MLKLLIPLVFRKSLPGRHSSKKKIIELKFDDKKVFNRFVKHVGVLSVILNQKPETIFELSRIVEMDTANINKLVTFFEKVGAVKVITKLENGRPIKRKPIVEYDQILFDLRTTISQ